MKNFFNRNHAELLGIFVALLIAGGFAGVALVAWVVTRVIEALVRLLGG